MMQSENVLERLIDAVERRDSEQFLEVCQTNADAIFEHFGSWTIVPEELREQPEKLSVYANTLIRTAQLFARSGYPQLLAMLAPPGENNVLTEWNERFAEARQLANIGDQERSLIKTESLLADLENAQVSGPGLIDLRAKVKGLKGDNLFALKRYADARAAMAAALEDCEIGGDEKGVRIYRANLEVLETHDPTRPELLDIETGVLKSFVRARRLTDIGRFQASNQELSNLLALTGEAAQFVDAIRPHILARMGFNEYKVGNTEGARVLIEAARNLCGSRQDVEGVNVYAENLFTLNGDPSSTD